MADPAQGEDNEKTRIAAGRGQVTECMVGASAEEW
jgi:hypothetical protein